MDGSKEDGQAGCTGNLYWDVVKKACGVDQYEAPPMDVSNNGQARAPVAVPVGAPATPAVVQGPVAPAAGPVGVLASAATKGGPTGGWSLRGRQRLYQHPQRAHGRRRQQPER
jgi:hypothetical protein